MQLLFLSFLSVCFVGAAEVEKHQFQTEVSRVMDIITFSLYKNKEVFLRELISNASDAIEKHKISQLHQGKTVDNSVPQEIRVIANKDEKTLKIVDSGIGMSKQELISNLGTIAKSGTATFLEQLKDTKDSSLIGQFGVGFYAAYLVSEKVIVRSRRTEKDPWYEWESSTGGEFTVKAVDQVEDDQAFSRGTIIMMHIKEDALEYLEESKLRELIKKYSAYIQFPVQLMVKKEKPVEKKEEEGVVEDEAEKKEPETTTVFEYEHINTQPPIWTRPKDSITQDEYNAFYKSISKDYQEPLLQIHFQAEGEVEFKSLLFIPKKAPSDLNELYSKKGVDVKLHVRRVMVQESIEDTVIPRYLGFLKGLIDSDDLPLNVSREQLQEGKVMKFIGKRVVKKVLDVLKSLMDEKKVEEENKKEEDKADEVSEDSNDSKKKKESTYDLFYNDFSKFLKLGCYEDDSNRNKIAKLLKFRTLNHKTPISLDDYIKENDDGTIYYISGEEYETLANHPALDLFKRKKIDVLFLVDQIDEPCFQRLSTYEGKKLQSVQKADLKLKETDEEKKEFKQVTKMYKPLLDWFKDLIQTENKEGGVLKSVGVSVDKVTVSKRLGTESSPLLVSSSKFGYSAQQEKMMKAQAFQNKEMMGMMIGKKDLEINPRNPVINNLLKIVSENKEDKQAKETGLLLFQVAILEAGFELNDTGNLVKSVFGLVGKNLGVDLKSKVELELEELEAEDEKEGDKKVQEEEDGDDDFNFDDFSNKPNETDDDEEL